MLVLTYSAYECICRKTTFRQVKDGGRHRRSERGLNWRGDVVRDTNHSGLQVPSARPIL